MEIILLVGIQASGKTSFYVERLLETHVRLSLDVVRTRAREQRLLAACLAAGQRVVIDNTNPTRAERATYIGPARAARFRVVGYLFLTRPDDAVRRNASRPPRRRVPVRGVLGTQARLQPPSPDEGFDALHTVRCGGSGGVVVEDWRPEAARRPH